MKFIILQFWRSDVQEKVGEPVLFGGSGAKFIYLSLLTLEATWIPWFVALHHSDFSAVIPSFSLILALLLLSYKNRRNNCLKYLLMFLILWGNISNHKFWAYFEGSPKLVSKRWHWITLPLIVPFIQPPTAAQLIFMTWTEKCLLLTLFCIHSLSACHRSHSDYGSY